MKRPLTLLLLSLFFLQPFKSFAELPSGTLTELDFYGTPPPLNEDEQAYVRFLKRTKKGGTLRLSITENMELIFPSWFQKGLQKKILPQSQDFIYQSLFGADPVRAHRGLKPLIAKSVESDPANKTYLINLRDDVTFSDGTKVTADDVLFSYKVKVEEISGEPHRAYYEELWGKHFTFEKVSPTQLRVIFPEVSPARQRPALAGILNSIHIVKENSKSDSKIQIPMPYLGTGPYVVVEADRERAHLVRRKDYWTHDPTFNFDEIFLTLYRDVTTRREALKRHDIDLLEDSRPATERELDGTNLFYKKTEVKMPVSTLIMNVLNFNFDRETLKDVRVRQALILAFNTEDIHRIIFADKFNAVAAPGLESPYSPHGLASNGAKQVLAENPDGADALNANYDESGYIALSKIRDRRERFAKALSLLREAGYTVDKSTNRLMRNGQPLELTLLMRNDDSFEGVYEFYRSNLQRLGIELHLRRSPDVAAYIVELRRNEYDLARSQMDIARGFDVLDIDILTQRLHSKYATPEFPINASHIRSPIVDKMLDELISLEPDDPRYKTDIEVFLRMISAKLPFILLGERPTDAVYADPKICLPPLTNWMLNSAFIADQCP